MKSSWIVAWEEVFQTEAVDQVQEDRVVGSPLANNHALLATVPGDVRLQLRYWAGELPEVVGEVEEGEENAVSLPRRLPRNPRMVVRR